MRALRLLTVLLALLLMIGEIWRSWGTRPVTAVLDDLIAGVLMIAAAWAVGAETLRTRTAFSATWGLVAGGLFGSFYSKLAAPNRVDAGNWSPNVLIWTLGAAFLVSLACLVLSILLPARPPGPA
ncbi:MAG: hypothetical protein ACJ8FO_12070 [Sphingomicrobium sp.]